MNRRLLCLLVGAFVGVASLNVYASSDSSPALSQELSLELGYDNNVTKSYAEHLSDGLVRLAYGLILRPNVFDNVSLNVGYGLGVKKYLSQFERDTIAHRGLFNIQYSHERIFAGIDAEIRYRGIRNGLRNYNWMELGSFCGLLFEEHTSIRINADFAKLDFEGSDYFDYWAQAYEMVLNYKPRPILFEISVRAEERNYMRPAYDAEFSDGDLFLIVTDRARRDVRTSLATRFGWRNGFVLNALYQAMINNSNSYGRTFLENSVGFEGGIPLFWRINIHAQVLLKLREYTQKAPLPQSSVLEEEEEGLSELGLSLTRPITDSIRVEVGYQRFWQAYSYYELEFYKDLVSAGIILKF